MMGEASEAPALRAGAEDGGATGGWVWVSGTGSTGSPASSGSGIGSSSSSVGDEVEDGDGAMSSSRPSDRRRHSSSLSSSPSTSSESEVSQVDAAAGGGPLYGMSTMRDDLPPAQGRRTGLSDYYKGRSESFTSLADVICVEDLAKRTTPYIRTQEAKGVQTCAGGEEDRSKERGEGI